MSRQYQWTDAWLLLSIIHAGITGKADSKNIIAAGDGINFAIFNPEELESGFARLTKGGWIKENAGIFNPPETPMQPYLETMTPRRSIRKQLEDIRKLLDAAPYNLNDHVPNPVNNLRYDGFSPSSYLKALEEYRRSFEGK